jgi:hypothetical protein
MTKTEMIDLMTLVTKGSCSQVADLQYYEGEGPFLFAVDEKFGEPKFFCFSFADADEFLRHPAALPLALESDNFPFALSEALDLDHLEGSGEFYQLTYYKIIPDDLACRNAVKRLWQSDRKTTSLIALLGLDGAFLPAGILCKDDALLQ